MTTSEKEDLEQLTTHPGWHRFLGYVKTQWGPVAYARQLEQAARALKEKPTGVEEVITAHTEINALLSWPSDRLRALEQQATKANEPATFSRRGAL